MRKNFRAWMTDRGVECQDLLTYGGFALTLLSRLTQHRFGEGSSRPNSPVGDLGLVELPSEKGSEHPAHWFDLPAVSSTAAAFLRASVPIFV
jgi:hypothetical protein